MKTVKISFLLICALFINSCSIDEDPVNTPSLYGTWNLVQVSGSVSGTTYNFAPGTIVWGFDLETIIVNNMNTDSSLQDGFNSGTYDYIYNDAPIENSECLQSISFSEDNINCIQFDLNTLVITQNAGNGLTYYFIR